MVHAPAETPAHDTLTFPLRICQPPVFQLTASHLPAPHHSNRLGCRMGFRMGCRLDCGLGCKMGSTIDLCLWNRLAAQLQRLLPAGTSSSEVGCPEIPSIVDLRLLSTNECKRVHASVLYLAPVDLALDHATASGLAGAVGVFITAGGAGSTVAAPAAVLTTHLRTSTLQCLSETGPPRTSAARRLPAASRLPPGGGACTSNLPFIRVQRQLAHDHICTTSIISDRN